MATTVGRVAEFVFRVVEQKDGFWVCHRGRDEFDFHAQLDDAIEHTFDIASQDPPSEVFVQHLDGKVQSIAIVD